MISIRKILYPTDFSEYANFALPYAAELAKTYKSEVIVLHVAWGSEMAIVSPYSISFEGTNLAENIEEASKLKLEDVKARFTKEGVTARGIVKFGTSFVEIIETAREEKVDLIVIATHGWGAVKHLLLGSTAERVVRKAPCPVLTVRHPEHDFVRP
jgi:nucleotide-binding universal stress UspA family protein